MKFSKGVHCPGTIITVSVATGTTLSSLQAADNFIMYISLSFCNTSSIGQADFQRTCHEVKGTRTTRSVKIPAGFL